MAFMGKSLSEKEQLYFQELLKFQCAQTPEAIAADPFLFVNRFTVTEALIRMKLFEMVQDVAGTFMECGTSTGSNFMLLAHISSIMEPYAITRKIVGFDTFEGFKSVDHSIDPARIQDGDMNIASLERLQKSIDLYDTNRAVGHMGRVEVVKGDACETIPKYVAEHPYLSIALLYLDFDIYQPTKVALTSLIHRVVKGGVVAFDQFNYDKFPGETLAVAQELELNNVEMKRFHWAPFLGYFRV
jgi:hypothetical protein